MYCPFPLSNPKAKTKNVITAVASPLNLIPEVHVTDIAVRFGH